MKARFIAFYLPQYHPIPENDKWYSPGFTEWTNVAKAKPLFKGHYQPHIPADLGFYDLRLKETRIAQANLAREYGIEAFCYWHYWFGEGRRLLETPFNLVLNDTDIEFPFCLAWANHSWQRKMWDNQTKNETIMEQKYGGESDYISHFYSLLPAFKDNRYLKVDHRLFFIVYNPFESEDIPQFLKLWRSLAQKEGIDGFYFVAKTFYNERKEELLSMGFDSVYNETLFSIHHRLSFQNKMRLAINRKLLKKPTTFDYSEAINYMITEDDFSETTIPVVVPNWDHSPRSGNNGIIFTNANPKYFKQLVKKAIACVSSKNEEKRIILIRSWNEWGEGNHLEPDLRYGKGYLEAIRLAIQEMKN
jgi:hypothetical protein